MAINYTKVGWDTSKYVNPTNMNQMDDGIKAACDAIDSEVLKLTNDALQTIANTATGANAAVSLKSNNVRSVADYRDQNGTALGMMGFDSNKKPTIYDVPSNAWKEIALADNVLKLSSTNGQTISATAQVGFPLTIKSGRTDEATIKFAASNDNVLGFFGIQSGDKPVFYGSSGSGAKQIATIGTLTVTNGTIDADGNMALSLSNGQYPIMWVRAAGANGDLVVFFDGSATPNLQPYAHFETLRNTTLSGIVVYVQM